MRLLPGCGQAFHSPAAVGLIGAVWCAGLAGFISALVYSYAGEKFARYCFRTSQLLAAKSLVPPSIICCPIDFNSLATAACADGPQNRNYYTAVWVSGIAMLMSIQAACVILQPSCSTGVRPRARFWAWMWYSAWMAR